MTKTEIDAANLEGYLDCIPVRSRTGVLRKLKTTRLVNGRRVTVLDWVHGLFQTGSIRKVGYPVRFGDLRKYTINGQHTSAQAVDFAKYLQRNGILYAERYYE